MNNTKIKIERFIKVKDDMAHGAIADVKIAGSSETTRAYISADSGLFCPYSDDVGSILYAGLEFEAEIYACDNCDRDYIVEHNKEEQGVFDVTTIQGIDKDLEKEIIGEVIEINEEKNEIEIHLGQFNAIINIKDSLKIAKIGKRVKVIADFVIFPTKPQSKESRIIADMGKFESI